MEKEKTEDSEALLVRAKALKGLIELVNGDVKSGSANGLFVQFIAMTTRDECLLCACCS